MSISLSDAYMQSKRDWGWQYIFPVGRRSIDPHSGIEWWHHVSKLVLQRAVKAAVRQAGSTKPASCHPFQDAFATHLLKAGDDIRTVQELLGHQDVNTTMIYTHVLNRGGRGVRSHCGVIVQTEMAVSRHRRVLATIFPCPVNLPCQDTCMVYDTRLT